MRGVLQPIAILALCVGGLFASAAAVSFQAPSIVDNLGSVDSLPSALQFADGTTWVVWQSYTTKTAIYFSSFNGLSWSPYQQLTSSSVWSFSPTLSQLKNGTVLFVWASNMTGNSQIYYRSYNSGAWGSTVQVTSGSFDDFGPKSMVASDGRLWIVWYRETFSSSCVSGICRQVFYKILAGNVWSQDIQLTSDQTWNVFPAPTTVGGGLWVSYSKWTSSGALYNLFYRTYNGTTWSAEIQLTSVNTATFGDEHPALVLDRNGTMWAFWNRELKLSTTTFEDQLFYKNSTDLGTSWSADTQLTFGGNSTDPIDSREPSAIQGVDRSVYVFFSSDITNMGSSFDIYYLKSAPILGVHNVAVNKIQASPSVLYPGGLKSVNQSPLVHINVTVVNLGDFSETISVSLTAVNKTSYPVGTATTTISPRSPVAVISFTWNTTSSVKPGRYGFVATISPVPGESFGNTPDNTLVTKNLVHLLPLGDVNQDGVVNLIDASIMAYGYGSRVGSSRYNPYADINGNGVIDLGDASVLAVNYGTRT